MRVLVLGGAGAVCNETTRDLVKYSDFDAIVVADYNLEIQTVEQAARHGAFFNAKHA